MTSMIHSPAGKKELALIRFVLAGSQLADWTLRIDARYEALESARRQGGVAAVSQLLPPGERFVPTASSLTIGAVSSDVDLNALLAAISAGPAGEWIKAEFGSPVACDRDESWVRRQYAPAKYPPLHAPHDWHQDGALRFDYLSHLDGVFPPDALLSMVTCWIPLGPCGDVAPGLELVTRRPQGLLAPAHLLNERVQSHFAAEEFLRPVLASGDALLFHGDILHRTHVKPAMTKDRTSIELRFFLRDCRPARLKDDRFIALV
jgi:hypothetical protein